MMAYLLPYLLPFLLYIEFQGKSIPPFCFCCFLCCLSFCFSLPGKPTIKALSWGQAWCLPLHHCLPVSGKPCYDPAAVLALLSCFLGRVKHLPCGRYFQLYCNDHSVPLTSLLTQMWAVKLILFSQQPDVRGCDTGLPRGSQSLGGHSSYTLNIRSSARGHDGTPEMWPWTSPQQSSYSPGGTAAMAKAVLEKVSSKDSDHGWVWAMAGITLKRL